MFTGCYMYICFRLLFTVSCFRLICAQTNFSLDNTSFICSSTLICLGDAHRYGGDANGDFAGSLSLVVEEGNAASAGIAYYSRPVRMQDPSTQRSASFNATFSFNEIQFVVQPDSNATFITVAPGDGPAFVMSAKNSATEIKNATYSNSFGFFNALGATSFKSIVVEFETWSDNVSLHFMNSTPVATETLMPYESNVGASSDPNSPVHTWVEYSSEAQQLEVRVSVSSSRPSSPVLTYKVDLFDMVEENMWVGFSGSTQIDASGQLFASYYYIREWSFVSWGVPLAPAPAPFPFPAPVPAPTPAPAPVPVPTPVPALAHRAPQSIMGIVLAISIGVPALFAIVIIFVVHFVRRRRAAISLRLRGASHRGDPALQLPKMPEEYRFHYKHLSVATGGFSDASKLGQGGFGNVYRGVMPTSGVPVAVKKINNQSNQGEREFMAEVSIISQIRHRNLIQLLGWCDDRGNYLIVYELMPHGSLDKVLFRPAENHPGLSWAHRFNIITGLAAAVEYLHQGWKQQVIHRDIKSSNVMLDDKWNAKLGDFGLARLVDHERTAATTRVAGTHGYLAPEAAASGKFTDKTDVFAFGAVALEAVCGRKAFASHKAEDEEYLVDWVWQRRSEGDLLSVVDSRLSAYDTQWMELVLQIGLLCSHPDPVARPTMRHVVQMLAGEVPVPWIPHTKPVPVFTTSQTGS